MNTTEITYDVLLKIRRLGENNYRATFKSSEHFISTDLRGLENNLVGLDTYGKWWVEVGNDQ